MESHPTAAARPASIITFERCYLGAWALGLINTAINWRGAVAAMNANPDIAQLGSGFSSTMLIGGTAISALITLVLWYFVARQGASVAKWIVVVFYALGVISFLMQLMHGISFTLPTILTLIQLALQTVAVVMLFRPDAKLWFGEGFDEDIATDIGTRDEGAPRI